MEVQLATETIRKTLGFFVALETINRRRACLGQIHMGISAFRNAVKKLKPQVKSTRRRKQGNILADSAWAVARHGLVMQILIALLFPKITSIHHQKMLAHQKVKEKQMMRWMEMRVMRLEMTE